MILYWPAYAIMTVLQFIYFPIKVFGREHIPQSGFIIASNHISNLDPPLLSYVLRLPISHMAKEELFKNKFTGWLFREMGGFPVKRGRMDIGAIRECLRRLKSGSPVSIFPTGTRTEVIKETAIKSGVGFLAIKSQVPVLPIKIIGSDAVMPRGSKFFKRHPVTILIGQPLTFDAKTHHDEAAAQILSAIASLAVPTDKP